MPLPRSVHVFEVGPRDGLQAETAFVSTDAKVALIDALTATGLSRVQATSFVRAEWIPQLADAEEVMRRIVRPRGVEINVLAPNRRGFDRAAEAGADSVELVVSASATHNRKNLNREPEETLREYRELVAEASLPVYCAIATAFGCPYEGPTPIPRVVDLSGRLFELGIVEVSLGDTTGMGNPEHVRRLCTSLQASHAGVPFRLHFHDTRGMGLANVLAGLDVGIDRFDGSVGGLGGCPYAPGATGNVVTEDLVHMIHEMGVETGIDLDALISCARLAQEAVRRPLESAVLRAGKTTDLVGTA